MAADCSYGHAWLSNCATVYPHRTLGARRRPVRGHSGATTDHSSGLNSDPYPCAMRLITHNMLMCNTKVRRASGYLLPRPHLRCIRAEASHPAPCATDGAFTAHSAARKKVMLRGRQRARRTIPWWCDGLRGQGRRGRFPAVPDPCADCARLRRVHRCGRDKIQR